MAQVIKIGSRKRKETFSLPPFCLSVKTFSQHGAWLFTVESSQVIGVLSHTSVVLVSVGTQPCFMQWKQLHGPWLQCDYSDYCGRTTLLCCLYFQGLN